MFFGCKSESKNFDEKTIFYPSKEYVEKHKILEIDLDKTELNYKSIIHFISKIQIQGKRTLITIEDHNITRKIIPYVDAGGYRKMKNVLQIKEDSILIDHNYPIKDLSKILARHYENNGKILQYSDSPKKAIVEITIDTASSGSELKKILLTLTKEFDILNTKHKDSLDLIVYLDYFKQMRFPPPAPSIE